MTTKENQEKLDINVLLRRATQLNQPENEKVYFLGDYVAVRSETNELDHVCDN